MSVNLSKTAPIYFCTWVDVISLLATSVDTEKASFSQQEILARIRHTSQLDNYCAMATQFIRLQLAKISSNFTSTGWNTKPVPQQGGGAFRENIGDGDFVGLLVNGTPKPAVWRVEITTPGNVAVAKYKLISYIEGIQGENLAMNADNTSSNGDVTIGSNSFIDGSKTWEIGDGYFFSVNTAKEEIWVLATTLAAAFLINSIFGENDPNESRYGGLLYNRATGMINKLSQLPEQTIIPMHEAMDYYINRYGQRVTPTDVLDVDTWDNY